MSYRLLKESLEHKPLINIALQLMIYLMHNALLLKYLVGMEL